MYRFALRPKWILRHVLVVVLVVIMVNLGFWQLRRLDEKQARNDLVAAGLAAEPAALDELVAVDAPVEAGDDVRYRRAAVTGRYLADDEVLVRNRTFDGQPGSWVLTPLDLGDGTAVVVGRGWVPVTGGGSTPVEAVPPSGPVEVTGVVETSQTRGRIGPTDPEGRVLDTLSRVDLDRLQQQVDAELYPVWVQLDTQAPAADELPAPVGLPELTEGPHLGYAVQWFVFSAIAVIGYPLILRRAARST